MKVSSCESCNAPCPRSLDEVEVEGVFQKDSGFALDHMRTLLDSDGSEVDLYNPQDSVLFVDEISRDMSFMRVL